MTTLAILSDIHGNLPALEAVMADMARFPIDHVIVAGDVINWGPFSRQVLERVTGAGWAAIRGNNEFYLVDYDTPRAPAAWSDRTQYSVMYWLYQQLRGHWQNVIAAWPDQLNLRFPDAPPIRVVHGSPRSAFEALYPIATEAELTAALAGVAEATVITGHTHIEMDRTVGQWRILNPGTVGCPIDGGEGARYMLLEARDGAWRAAFRNIPYDPAPLFAEFERQRFVETCGVVGQLIVEEFQTARLRLGPFNAWRAAACPDTAIGAELLAEFAKVHVWDYIPAAYHINC
jgi:predicted phosphodiesterase